VVTDVFRLLLHVGDLLDQLGIRYAVGGSLASGIHGEVRATNDIDVLIEIPEDRISALVAALKPTFDVWEDTVRAAVNAGRSFSVLHLEWHVKVDFFPAGASPLDQHELARRLAVQLPAAPGTDVYVATAEDIVLRKLEWYRRSGDVLERQLRDVVGVMKLRGQTLDMAYLRRWARELGVEELLARTLEDSGLSH
jgi:hypothetical protein